MSISVSGAYSDALYKWQGQKLVSSGSSGSASKNSAAASLFSGTSMTSQISSLVELTRYAMDAMGVSSNSRVTFSQISKYREQLQSEFNQGVKAGFAAVGVSDPAGLTYTLDKNGAITVAGANASDRQYAQAWIDANPSIGKELLANMEKAGVSGNEITFTVSTAGALTLVDGVSKSLRQALDANADLTDSLREAVKEIGAKTPLEFGFDDDGNLTVKNDAENSEKINAWLKDNPALADEVKRQLEKRNVDTSAATLRLGSEGNIQITANNATNNDIQKVLADSASVGTTVANAMASGGIDPNASFTIKVNDDGTLEIISDHPDKAKIQKFFEDNPDLVKKYRQIEALAGIDDARKAMQVSPSEMRKRIQIESMASWWADTGSSNSFFGQYSDGSLSLLSGLNMTV